MVHPTEAYFSRKQPFTEGLSSPKISKQMLVFEFALGVLVFLLPSLFQREGREKASISFSTNQVIKSQLSPQSLS